MKEVKEVAKVAKTVHFWNELITQNFALLSHEAKCNLGVHHTLTAKSVSQLCTADKQKLSVSYLTRRLERVCSIRNRDSRLGI